MQNRFDINRLLQELTIEEKIGQLMQLIPDLYISEKQGEITGPLNDLHIQEEAVWRSGSVLGINDAEDMIAIQRKYLEKSTHKIPLIFMADVIHGFRTVFPIPLALGCSWDLESAERSAEIAAKEAALTGIQVTFSPMADLVRDPRWGRVMESTGEDPYLNGLFAQAFVRGYQGNRTEYNIAACIKHFAAYGAAEAGREYNTVDMSDRTLREYYLPAYKAAISAGCDLVMTSFNTIHGIPASANSYLLRDILRKEWGFEGVVISDWAAVEELIAHGVAKDRKEAAKKAMEAGVDIEMMTSDYVNYLKELIQEGTIKEELLDEAVLRILKLKEKMGLFENPYKSADPEKTRETYLCSEHRKAARDIAGKSMVLLKNEGVLPLQKNQKIAVIGPFADNKSILGPWSVQGKIEDVVSLYEGLVSKIGRENVILAEGCKITDEILKTRVTPYGKDTPDGKGTLDAEVIFNGKDTLDGKETLSGKDTLNIKEVTNSNNILKIDNSKLNSGFAGFAELDEEQSKSFVEAIFAAREADAVILALGEDESMSGEAGSRGFLNIPGNQMKLAEAIIALNKPVAVVLINGRPLDIKHLSDVAPAILEAWFPGTEGGNAIVDVLFGDVNPSGRLTMSFPYAVGQIPVYYNYYNTGRPQAKGLPGNPYLSQYIDIPNEPLYPFGYGLSYTTFEYSEIRLDKDELKEDDVIHASVKVKNTGTRKGTETVQFYIRDIVGNTVRPLKELKGFKQIRLDPDEEKTVSFEITIDMLKYHDFKCNYIAEPGEFVAMAGHDSQHVSSSRFQLVI